MDVSVGINPDHTQVWAVPGVANNGTNCQAAKNTVDLEQHRFELPGPTYTWIFFSKYL